MMTEANNDDIVREETIGTVNDEQYGPGGEFAKNGNTVQVERLEFGDRTDDTLSVLWRGTGETADLGRTGWEALHDSGRRR